MRQLIFPISAALLCACGSTPLTLMAGTWRGPTTITGKFTASYEGQIVTTANGNTLTVAQVCPDGTGTINANGDGSGNSATWSGNYNCPAFASTTCTSVTLTYAVATMALNGTMEPSTGITVYKGLTFIATGTAAGCGLSGDITVTGYY